MMRPSKFALVIVTLLNIRLYCVRVNVLFGLDGVAGCSKIFFTDFLFYKFAGWIDKMPSA